jgi:uncharacterized RDD family membrane protein YckC
MNNLIESESNHLFRRFAAFAVDIIFAICVATAIPSAIAEATFGHYRLTGVPGLKFEYCHPTSNYSKSTAEIVDRAIQAARFKASEVKIENCTILLNLVARSTFVRVSFPPTYQGGPWRLLSIATDFSGDPTQIIPLDPYTPLFEAIFLVVFVASAWFDSAGMRMMEIRVRSPSGEKANFPAFFARYGILAPVFAPLLMPFGETFTKVAIPAVLGAALLLPWYKGRGQKRRSLQDIAAGTFVFRAF